MSLSLGLHRHEMGTIHIQRSLGSEARARAHGACPVPSLPTQSSSASRARGRGGGAGATGPACCEVRIEGTRLHPVCACSGRWHRGGIRVFTPERWAPQQSFATPSPDQRDVHCVFTCKGTPVHFYIIVKLLLLCYLFFFFACLKSLDFCGGG